MNTPIPFRKSDQFLNRLRSVKNIEELKNLAKEIGNYVSINKNDEESKLILAEVFIILGEDNKASSVLNKINLQKLKEDKKVEYIASLLSVGNIEKALEVAKSININLLNKKSKLSFLFLYLEIFAILKKYDKALDILKTFWEELYREKFTYDKFFYKLNDFLINLESLSAIKGTDFVLEDLILYIKAQKEVEENKIYKNILEIGKEVLKKEFDNFNIFFQMSTDEDIMTMVIDIRDRQTPLKDLIPLKKSISKEIREAVKKQMKKVPLFAIRVDVPILKDNLQEEAVAT